MAETISSYADFLEEHGLEPSQEAFSEYSIILSSFREKRARELGISLEELHSLHFSNSESD